MKISPSPLFLMGKLKSPGACHALAWAKGDFNRAGITTNPLLKTRYWTGSGQDEDGYPNAGLKIAGAGGD
jgi:hypothetical protein